MAQLYVDDIRSIAELSRIIRRLPRIIDRIFNDKCRDLDDQPTGKVIDQVEQMIDSWSPSSTVTVTRVFYNENGNMPKIVVLWTNNTPIGEVISQLTTPGEKLRASQNDDDFHAFLRIEF